MSETGLSYTGRGKPIMSIGRCRKFTVPVTPSVLTASIVTAGLSVITALGAPALGQSAADLTPEPAPGQLVPEQLILEQLPDLPALELQQPVLPALDPLPSEQQTRSPLRIPLSVTPAPLDPAVSEPAAPNLAAPELTSPEPTSPERSPLAQPAPPQPTLDAARSLPPSAPSTDVTPLPPRYPSDASFLLPPRPIFAEPQSTAMRLVLRLSDRRVYLYRGDDVEVSYPVAVGKAGWETPVGSYEVMAMIEDPSWENPFTGAVIPAGPDNPLGDRWIGFWTDGSNFIGFHGTPNEGSVGRAASHGCVRMYNRDINELFTVVAMGTPVIVEQ